VSDINYSIIGQVSKGPLSQSFQANGVAVEIAAPGVLSLTLGLGTATQAIATASLAAVGVCFARNLSTTTTHTVSFGRLNGTTLYETVKLKGSEAAVLRLAPGDYAAKAGVAGTTRLLITVYED
jgi:hypothetical protein